MIWAYIVFWLGAIGDWYTTKRIWVDGGGKELNGFVRKFVDTLPWDTEIEIFIVKAIVFGSLLWLGAPALVYYIGGGIQLLAAIGNKLDWWGWLVRKYKEQDF